MPHGTDVYCPELTQADNKQKCEYTAKVDKFHGGHDTPVRLQPGFYGMSVWFQT